MAVASGRVAARKETTVSILAAPPLMAAAGNRVVAECCCKRNFRVQSRQKPCARRQSRSTHEASAFKVDEGDLFIVSGIPHGGRKRPRGCSAASDRCYSRRSPPHGGRRRPRSGRTLPREGARHARPPLSLLLPNQIQNKSVTDRRAGRHTNHLRAGTPSLWESMIPFGLCAAY